MGELLPAAHASLLVVRNDLKFVNQIASLHFLSGCVVHRHRLLDEEISAAIGYMPSTIKWTRN